MIFTFFTSSVIQKKGEGQNVPQRKEFFFLLKFYIFRFGYIKHCKAFNKMEILKIIYTQFSTWSVCCFIRYPKTIFKLKISKYWNYSCLCSLKLCTMRRYIQNSWILNAKPLKKLWNAGKQDLCSSESTIKPLCKIRYTTEWI